MNLTDTINAKSCNFVCNNLQIWLVLSLTDL